MCHFGPPHPLALRFPFALPPSNSFVSPSYAPFTRNPFVSPTYAKTRGVPPSPEPRRASHGMTNRFISEFSLARSSASLLFSAFSLRYSAHSAPLRYLFLCHCLPVLHGASTFLSGNSAPNRQFSAINGKSANITLRLSIILSNIVGAPTFLIPHPNKKSQKPPASQGRRPLDTSHSSLAAKSNHSRTYARVTRKSNHSRTYAKHRGWGISPAKWLANNSFVFSRHVNYILNSMSNYIVGAPTFPLARGTQKRTGKNACATSHETRITGHASLLRRAEGGPYTRSKEPEVGIIPYLLG